MAKKNKTTETEISVLDFINAYVDNDQKKTDSFRLMTLMSEACIYVKKLSDINILTLEKMCIATIAYLNEHHECACRT